MNNLFEHKLYRILGIVLMLEATVFAGVYSLVYNFDYKYYDAVLLCVVFFFFMIDYLLLTYISYRIKNDKSEYRKYLLKKLDSDENKEDIKEKKTEKDIEVSTAMSDEKDIIALMLKNNDEIAEYFKISKGQAKSSYWFSIIACIIGIAMIGLSIYGFLTMKDIQFTIIGIVGGAITELIAGTVLVIHNKSALQLNYYYDALHENEKILSAINLADKLPEDQRIQMYIEIIRSQIEKSISDKGKTIDNSQRRRS